MTRGLRMTEEAYAARMKRKPATIPASSEAEVVAAMSKAQHGDLIAIKAGVTVNTTKYRNVKTEVDSIKFDSKREATRYAQLQRKQEAGIITGLERQVKFVLIPSQKREDGTTERAATYTVDFMYWRDGRRVHEDSKGIRTQQGVIRRKLMLFIHGITVREV